MASLISRLLLLILLTFSFNSQAKNAQRIIALSPHSVEMLYAIGAGDRIIATVEHSDYPSQAKSILRIGNYTGIQIEKVLQLEPDLVVVWRSGNKAADLEKLKSLGLKTYNSQPKDISQISDDLRNLGKLTGLEYNAQIVIDKLNREYQQLKNKYQNKQPVSVFYQMWHDPLRSVGPGSWIEKLIRNCGGQNIFDDSDADYPLVSLESILVKNPKVIIIPHHSGNVGEKTNIWKKWPEISAVKEKHIYSLNGDLLHRFTPRALDGLEALCEKIDEARKDSK